MAYQFLSTILGINANFTGNVGVGTTTPFSKLTVSGVATGEISSEDTTSTGSFVRILGDISSQNLINWQSGTALRFATSDKLYGSFTEYMRITAIGNIGIGTASPIHKLSVVGKIGADIFSDSYLEFLGNGNTILKANNDVYFGYSQNSVVKQNGNFLIGTTTDAGYKLFVNGSIANSNSVNGTGDYGIALEDNNRLGFNQSGVRSWSMKASGGNLNVYSGDGNGTFAINMYALVSSLSGSGTRMVVADGSGTLSTQSIPTGTVTGSGTTNYIPKWTSSSALGNSLVYDDGINIGIGTTTPGYKLDVNGTARIQGNTTITATNIPLSITGSGSSAYSMNSGNDVYFAFNSQSANGRFYANPQGTVQYTYDQPSSVGFVGTLAGGSVWYGNMNSSGGAVKYNCSLNGSTHSHIWYYNFTEQMRLQYTGNLLIGTSTDNGAKLQVNGTSSFAGDVALNGNRLYIGSVLGNTVLRPISTTNLQLFNANAGAGLFLDANGYVQIGQSNAVNWAYFSASGHIIYGTTNTNFFTSGNVGINQGTDAGYKLDVNGTGRFQNNLTLTNGGNIGMYISRGTSTSSNSIIWQTASTFDWFLGSSPLGTSTSDLSLYSYGTSSIVLNIARSTGVFTLSSLSGSGTRMVVADSTGTLSTQSIPTGTVTGSGTTNYVSKWTGTTVLGNSLIYDDGTNVGIGTTTPSYKLDVNGTGRFTSNLTVEGFYNVPSTSYFKGNASNGYRFNNEADTVNLFILADSGLATFSNLAGSGTRMVVANASGTLSTQSVPTGTVTGSGTTNYVSKWSSSSSLTNSLLYDNGTNVGIGTTSPAAKLEVRGSTAQLLISQDATHQMYFGVDNSYAEIQAIRSGIAFDKPLILQRQGGNVGIGATNPAAKLHLSQSSGNTESIIEAIGGTPIFTMLGTSSSVPLFGFNGTGLRIGSVTGANAAGFSELMRITSAGNVGIGTSSPGSKLEISGPTGSYSSGIGFTPTGTGARVYRTYIGTNGFFYFDDASAGATRITLSASGNLGIGTNNPDYFATSGRTILSLNGASNTLIEFKVGDAFQNYIYSTTSTFELYSSSIIDFQSLGASRLRIASSGNVLIGTTTDNGYKLQVSGRALVYTGATVTDSIALTVADGSNGLNYIPYVGTGSYNNLSYGGGSLLFNNISSRLTVGTHNGTAIQFGPTDTLISGAITLFSLAGSGTRMVVADASGVLSTQAIPGGGGVKAYGSWQNNNTQLSPANNFPTPVIYDTLNFNNNVIVDNDSSFQYTLIRMLVDGRFNIQFSFEFRNTSSSDEDVNIWFRKNGETTSDDIPNSNTLISIPAKHGSGTPGHTVAAWNFFVEATAGEFFQIVWATSNKATVTMEYIPPTAFCPGTPSAILTVNKID